MTLQNHTFKFTWLVALAFISCMEAGKKNEESKTISNEEINTTSLVGMETNTKQVQNIKQLKYFYNIDKTNGLATERIPFPATWEQHDSGEFAFTGPNGIKVYGQGGQYFHYSNDPMMMDLYQQTGMKVKYPLTMEQSIDEFLISTANKSNRKMVKKYPIPQLLEGYKNFVGMIFKTEQNPVQFDATAIEWVDPDGTRWLTVFFYQFEQGQGSILWGCAAGAIGAPEAYFKQAKQDYLNGILNKQINPQWIFKMNQTTESTIRRGEEAHASREAQFKSGVAQRQQQWQADQELKARNQKQWEANQEAISRRNEMVSDAILGKVNIIDPQSGESSKIDNTNNRYWVNSQNEYIGTNTTYHDPNKNSYMNGETWREFKIDNYKN